MQRGEFNYWVVISGVNGSGKTTRAKARVAEVAAKGVRVFIHDPNDDYLDVPAYRSPEDWCRQASAAFAEKRAFSPVARFGDVDPDELVRLARSSAEVTAYTVPSLVVIDEGTMLAGAKTHGMSPMFQDTMCRRRHLAVGGIFLVQFPQLINRNVRSLATEIDVFAHDDERALQALREVGVPEQTLDSLRTLKRGQFWTIDKGKRFQ